MEKIKWNENEKSIYYKELETNIIKSIDLINKEIFQIQEHIIDYEQFGEKDINKLGEFSRNYPFQFSFNEFGTSNYWGCEGDEEYLNKMPIKNEERKEETNNGYVEFEFPENIRSKKDFIKLVNELFLNGIENFHPEDDFTEYKKLDEEEGRQVNNLFHQAINFLGDSELYKTLTKIRDKYLDLKYVYKVEHIRGYDFNEDQSHKISFSSLHEIKDEEWNMSAYHGEEWEEQFRNLKIGEVIESLVICEWVRFTRIF